MPSPGTRPSSPSSRRSLSRALPLAMAAAALIVVLPGTISRAWQEKDKHGGDILFEVKKNKRNLPHVLFSHESHLDAGHDCGDCHDDKVFRRKRELGINRFTMKDIMDGKACGACHDEATPHGESTVFGPKNKCERCHDVKLRAAKK